ncbi:hypothetical protein [Methylobacterium currus]|uniref:hypothetical protein n=1 Tax=Methylobacterium currus TaxID=2051553 RepID=UPI0013DF061C|nr:hypothetical protein [Methylobacterium currus]
MSETEKALRAVLPKARSAAARVGAMHGSWDAIFDAEALLAGKPTLLRFGSREEGIEVLYDLLKSHE